MKLFNGKKLISVLLVVLMTLSLFSVSVLAEEAEETPSVYRYFTGPQLEEGPTVDGDLSDDAWSTGWRELNNENGIWDYEWAEGNSAPDLVCQYNIKYDAEGLYFAAVLNQAPVNNTGDQADKYQTTATNIRFWIYDGRMEEVEGEEEKQPFPKFTQLYDFNFAEDGTVTQKRNPDENPNVVCSGAKTDSASMVEAYIPFSDFDSSDISAFKFFLSVSAPGLGSVYDKEPTGDEGFNTLHLNGWTSDDPYWSSHEYFFKISPDLDYLSLDSDKDGFNRRIAGEDIVIFTSEIGETVTSDNGNITWATSIVAEYNEDDDNYVVSKVVSAPGAGASIEMPENGIIVTVHSDSVGANKYQKYLAMEVAPGDTFTITGIDLENQTFEDGARIDFVNRFALTQDLLATDEPDDTSEDESATESEDESAAESTDDTSETPSTGDLGMVAIVVALMALVASGVVVVRRRRG